MSKQTLIPFNKFHAEVKVKPKVGNDGYMTGELSEDTQLLLSQNMQILRFILSEDGHATPSRTNADLATLSIPQYIGRYAYNADTKSPMTNVDGTYKNIMTSSFNTKINFDFDGKNVIARINDKNYILKLEEIKDG